MPDVIKTLLEIPGGYRSIHAARYVGQMDDQSRRLIEGTRDMTVDELGWQPAPGMNTAGMLLAHIAVAETHITAVGIEGLPTSDVPSVLGIQIEDDGLPLPASGHPPAALEGKDIAWFHGLLEKARANTKRVAIDLTDADLGRQIARNRPDGTPRILSVDWALYHILEHGAGHHGQILMLRHLCRTSRAGV